MLQLPWDTHTNVPTVSVPNACLSRNRSVQSEVRRPWSQSTEQDREGCLPTHGSSWLLGPPLRAPAPAPPQQRALGSPSDLKGLKWPSIRACRHRLNSSGVSSQLEHQHKGALASIC